MPKVYLKRRERFSASHRLHSEQLSESENKKLYGKCNSKNGHGHNYELWVTVYGEVNNKDGMVLSLEVLKEKIHESIINKVDHKHLNFDIDFLSGVNPTAENLVVHFWKELEKVLPLGFLYELTLFETENNHVSYRGE